MAIGHFGKYHDTLCLSPKIFQFLLGLTIESDLFTFCQTSEETVKHLFFQCVYSNWNDFENCWLTLTKKKRKLEYESIIFGILDEKSDLLNYLLILGKLYLWNCRKKNCGPAFSPFEVIVQSKYNTEKLIAVQGKSSFKRFQAKWKLFIKWVILQDNECYWSLKYEVMYMWANAPRWCNLFKTFFSGQ